MRGKIMGAIVRLLATSIATLVLFWGQPAYAAVVDQNMDGDEQPAQIPGSGDRPITDARGATGGGTRGNTKGKTGGTVTGAGTVSPATATPTPTVTGAANTPTDTDTITPTGAAEVAAEATVTPTDTDITTPTVDTITEDEEAAEIAAQVDVAGFERAAPAVEMAQQMAEQAVQQPQAIMGAQQAPVQQLPSTATQLGAPLGALAALGGALYWALRKRS